MSRNFYFLLVFLGFFSATTRADVLVLVHGYLGNAYSWESSGINGSLEAQGWMREGILRVDSSGVVRLTTGRRGNAQNKSYRVELPSTAPIMIQANVLRTILNSLALRHPGEPMHLVGHSAGGVVARAALILGVNKNIQTLITIAAPHLGTHRAIEALNKISSSGPIGWFKNMFGGDLYHRVKRSRSLLMDLLPVQPGNLLFWLNSRVHPDVRYVSILRSGPVGLGDELVPAFSQDMNRVPALSGKAEVVVAPTSHSLNPEDGYLIARLLNP